MRRRVSRENESIENRFRLFIVFGNANKVIFRNLERIKRSDFISSSNGHGTTLTSVMNSSRVLDVQVVNSFGLKGKMNERQIWPLHDQNSFT